MTLVELVSVLLVKQRRVFVSVCLIGFAIAAAVTFLLPKEYTATATLVVGDTRPVATGSNSVPLDQVLVQNYRQLLGTPAVTQRVAGGLHMSPGQLASKMSFSVVTGTYLLDVTATDRRPEIAAAIANAYATTFVSMNQRAASGQDTARLAGLNRDISRLALQIARLRGSSNRTDAARALVAENRLSIDRDTIRALTKNDTLQGENVSMGSSAVVPGGPSQPKPKLYLTLGAVLALLLAAGAAFGANSFDSAVREPEQVEELLGAPTLALVPRSRMPRNGGYALPDEPLEFLRTNLELLAISGGPSRVIAVVGAGLGEGKTAIVTGLSKTLARAGNTVVAVDADVRRPKLHRAFGSQYGGAGLTDVLAGRVDAASALQLHESGVRILPAGTQPPNPALLFTRGHLAEVLSTLRGEADYVLIDTPPILAAHETSSITASVDGVLFVVNVETSKRRKLLAARDQLAKANAPIIGVVLNRVPRRQPTYYYPYSYGPPASNGDRRAPIGGARKDPTTV